MSKIEQDTRNVRQEFKGKTEEQIKKELAPRRKPLVYVLENIQGDFNFSSVVRTCNAFCGSSVIFVGKRKWDRRGAVGVQNYEDILYYEYMFKALEMLRLTGYTIAAAEQSSDSISLPEYRWAEKTALVLGEEQRGVSEETLLMVDDKVEIPQFGSVPSLNVANAAGIMTYDYMLKQGRFF